MLSGKVRVCIIDADYSLPTYDLQGHRSWERKDPIRSKQDQEPEGLHSHLSCDISISLLT